MESTYTSFIDSAKAELVELKGRRGSLELEKADIEAKIDGLTKTLKALAPLTSATESQDIAHFLSGMGDTASPVGITDRVRVVLKSRANETVSPGQVKELLQGMGWDLGRYANATSTIHTILKRLVESGEAVEVGNTPPDMGKKYRAAPPKR